MSKTCPYCGEQIADSAKKCRYCGEWLEETSISEPQPPVYTQPPVYPQPPIHSQPPIKGEPEKDETPYSFFEAYYIIPYIRQFADFKTCASRSDFWFACLMNTIVTLGLCGIAFLLTAVSLSGIFIGSAILGIYSLFVLIPSLALGARRLRDAGKSPWLLLMSLIPCVGSLILLIMYCLPSKDLEDEDYGDYYDLWTRWSTVDWAVTCGSVVIFFAGIFMLSSSSMIEMFSGVRENNAADLDNIELYTDNIDRDVEDAYEADAPVEVEEEFGEDAGESYTDTYTGYIGKYPIEMQLTYNDNELTGRYRYLKTGSGGWLELKGQMKFPAYADGALVELFEYNDKGRQTGHFTGEMGSDESGISGDYTNYKGKNFHFEIERD
ncbi:MAG: DUF805 domain-containing protein [Firmicutes bacterium]|nr:DUF805 domain-containing protein [Bacillota bacterium]MCM1402135.1 DUF805 domain-containing protein [Bacteroides sp.]MCM1477174.1 DUF805 domain-containing protein [Bacteroides sp.]